ncbi:uncharacterized protein LOC141676882 isoform X2 [Apium graveolens]|uniref:uncharacterized protein LOC141676882 isoform X2 n=1 Tax=Apium graveolens TaxID=4045 RepID=UPI003D7A51ED
MTMMKDYGLIAKYEWHLQILFILESYFGTALYKSKSNQVTKVRDAQRSQYNYMLVVGVKEASNGKVFVIFAMDEDNNESSSSRDNKKKTKGPTLCSKLKEKIKNQKIECDLEFDEDGNPIGEMAPRFACYVGTAGRLHVNINIKSWDIVSQG